MSQQFENDELKLICDEGEVPDDVLCTEAAKIWSEIGYGVPRRGPAEPRVDTGVPRKGLKRTGEQAWVSERRRAVRQCVATGVAKGHLLVESTREDASGHKYVTNNVKEARFQKAKRLKHRIQAILNSSIDADSVSTAELEVAVAWGQDAAKRRKDLKKDAARVDKILNPTNNAIDFNDKKVFYDHGVLGPVQAREHATRHQLQQVDDICNADILVVSGFETTSWKARWSARLVGQTLACVPYFDDPLNTACVSYKAAIKTKRHMYFSTRAIERHLQLFQLVQRACGLPGSRWRILASMDALRAEWHRAHKGRPAEVWVVKTNREAKTDFPHGMKYVLSFEQLCTLIGVTDRSTTQMGICGV